MFYKKNETGYRVVMGGIQLTTFATKNSIWFCRR